MNFTEIVVRKRVNINEFINIIEKGYRNPLKKYNFSKREDRKLTKNEFNSIREKVNV